ncbi:MAG: hypothetical protein IPL52_00235 [Flavobacteriales bacterium]|nr:hypothetical protein [Flavobacteriales bacterium]
MMTLFAYAALALFTAAYAYCGVVLYRRTGDVSVPLGLALIYYWTFAGAWFFIGDSALGFQGYRIGLGYYYLMEKMFPFIMNGNYLLSLGAYALFALAMLAMLLLLVPNEPRRMPGPVRLDHRYMLVGGALCMLFSIVAASPLLQEAWRAGEPFYTVLRQDTSYMSTLRAWADRGAALCFVLGYAILLGSGDARSFFDDRARNWQRAAYPACMLVLGLYLSLLGDRHTLFSVLILVMIYLLDRFRRRGLRLALMPVLVIVVLLAFGGWVRGFSPQGVKAAVDRSPFKLECIAHVPRQQEGFVRKAGNTLLGNEMFAAHFSMFGIIERDVPVEQWISLRYVGCLVGICREDGLPTPSVYDHYAQAARLTPGQGYTIHHASGWYLNFGWSGVVLGGAFLGAVWGCMMRARARIKERSRARILVLMLPYLFVSYFPALLRSGPESYWGVAIEGILMPMTVIFLASTLNWPWRRMGLHTSTA